MICRAQRPVAIAIATCVVTLGALVAVAPRAAAADAQAENVPSINVTLTDPDPAHNTLSYVEANKDNVVPSTVSTDDASGAGIIVGTGAEFTGRGNYTWQLNKKPYQLKFSSPVSIAGLPSAKAWVLLANDADASLMRTRLAFDFASATGMPFVPKSRWIDLTVNGDFRGSYQITEKIEIAKNRIDLPDPQAIVAELDNSYGS